MNLQQASKSFIAVVEEKSFAAAARRLYCTSPKISKDINWLEEELKTKLLNRTTRKLSLTEAGQHFYQYAKQAQQDYVDIRKQLLEQQQTISGRLRIAGPTSFYEECISPYAIEFMQQYPDVRLEVELSNEFIDLEARQIDIAIRTTHSTNKNYHCEQLTSIQRGIFAATEYLKCHGTPQYPDDLLQHSCLVHSDISQQSRWKLKENKAIEIIPRYRCNSVHALVDATKAGLGCAYFADIHIRKALQEGTIQQILQEYAPTPFPIYICYQKSDFIAEKIAAFIKVLKNHFADY